MNGERDKMLKEVMAWDFALYDTVLYLDTHPNCPQGLAYYRKARAECEKARSQYEACFGPLTVYDSEQESHWDWTAAPWPWEEE